MTGLFSKFWCVGLTIVLLTFGVGSMSSARAGTYSGGSGTTGDPYRIATLDDLQELSTTSSDWYRDFIQTANIDATATSGWNDGSGFSPIGGLHTHFLGSYDGNGHVISNLYINRSGGYYQGLFGYTLAAQIRNLGLTDVNIRGKTYVGGLVGYDDLLCSISDCHTTGQVTGYSSVGGLVGLNRASLSKSYSTCTVTATIADAGGLVGENQNNLSNCYAATGSVNGHHNVGGLVGYASSGSISNCYSTGRPTLNPVDDWDGWDAGGLVGFKSESSSVSSSFWDTQTSGTISSAGGEGKTTAQMKNQSTFTGWNFEDIWDMDGSVNSGYPYLRPIYPVTYNTNGATSGTAPAAQVKIDAVSLTLQTNTGSLARTGYTFTDWNTAADGSGTNYAAGANYTQNAALALYAKWSGITYNVYLNKQGGTGGTSNVSVTYGQPMPAATAPTRADYIFRGYYTFFRGGGTQYYTAEMASARNWGEAATYFLYANWVGLLYRSKATGNWSAAGTWEQSTDEGITWIDADAAPDETSQSTTIRDTHTVTVASDVTTDQTTVASGGILTVESGHTLTIANGDGTDLTVEGTLTNEGTLTCANGSEVTVSGATDTVFSGAGTWTFKTLTLNKDAAATKLDINTQSDVTVDTALTVTRGTVDLAGWTNDLRLGGTLTIETNGRWTAHGDTSTHYVQFYGADCTFTDSSTGGPQNLGHVKVDE